MSTLVDHHQPETGTIEDRRAGAQRGTGGGTPSKRREAQLEIGTSSEEPAP